MKNPPERNYVFIQPGVWLSIHDLAIAMHRTVRTTRSHLRDRGGVPCAMVGDTEYFFTDDVIAFLEARKRRHGDTQPEIVQEPKRRNRRSAA